MDSVGDPGTAEVSAEETPGPTMPLAKSSMGSLSCQVLTFILCLKSISEGRQPTASNQCGDTGDMVGRTIFSILCTLVRFSTDTEINRAAQI